MVVGTRFCGKWLGVLLPKTPMEHATRVENRLLSDQILSWPMTLQTIRFRIRPDGRVEEQVKGLKGASCQNLTAELEARLGAVISSAPTEDHYAAAACQRQLQTASLGQFS